VLIKTTETLALDRAVEDIDAIWTEGLRVRQIGPSPAVSFCSLGWRRTTRKQARAAEALLGVDTNPDPEVIAAARKTRLKACPPEARTAIKDAAHLLTCMARASAPTPVAYRWREGTAAVDNTWKHVA